MHRASARTELGHIGLPISDQARQARVSRNSPTKNVELRTEASLARQNLTDERAMLVDGVAQTRRVVTR
jgi:hypothetical protein